MLKTNNKTEGCREINLTAENMESISIKIKVFARIEKEGDLYVSICPDLDIASQGETEQQARDNLAEAISGFILTCLEMGTLHQVLMECGFGKERPEPEESSLLDISIPFPSFSETPLCPA